MRLQALVVILAYGFGSLAALLEISHGDSMGEFTKESCQGNKLLYWNDMTGC